MKEVLDRGRVRLEQQYGGDPSFVARILIPLSGPYIDLGDSRDGNEHDERASELPAGLTIPICSLPRTAAPLPTPSKGGTSRPRACILTEGRRQIARIDRPSSSLGVECALSEIASGARRGAHGGCHQPRQTSRHAWNRSEIRRRLATRAR